MPRRCRRTARWRSPPPPRHSTPWRRAFGGSCRTAPSCSTAIGHDLRTPITRLKLRAEFVEDDEQRGKMLADLEELEAMVSATLAFGRDARTTEAVSSLDLAELLRTLLDEASDSRPDLVEQLRYEGPPHQTVRGRPLALKRALANLVSNAVNYGGGARLRLISPCRWPAGGRGRGRRAGHSAGRAGTGIRAVPSG